MACDLEQYRRDHSLTYERLAEQLGLSNRRRARALALGEAWPDADKLQDVIDRLDGAVSVECMYRRRLAYLSQTKGYRHQRQLHLAAE